MRKTDNKSFINQRGLFSDFLILLYKCSRKKISYLTGRKLCPFPSVPLKERIVILLHDFQEGYTMFGMQ